MKKFLFKSFVIVFALFAVTGIFAQQLRVVIAPFEVRAGFSKNEADVIDELFLIELAKHKNINVFDQSDKTFTEIANRMKFGTSDLFSQDNVIELGKALNANAVVMGRMMMLGNQRIITARIIDIAERQTQILATSQMELVNVSEAIKKMPEFVSEIVGNLGGGGQRPPATGARASNMNYKVGDTGPAGGIVFYDKGFVGDGWRYLEAAPAGAEFRAAWGVRGTNIGGTNTSPGFGKQNTQLLIASQGQSANYAAQLCAKLDVNGYKDWFLPSRDELNLMYQNLHRKGLGGFSATSWYWSSSQGDSGSAWLQRFSDGSQDGTYGGKVSTNSVRAVRAF